MQTCDQIYCKEELEFVFSLRASAPRPWLGKAFSNCISFSFDGCLSCASDQLPGTGTDSVLCSLTSLQISGSRSHHALHYLNPTYMERFL